MEWNNVPGWTNSHELERSYILKRGPDFNGNLISGSEQLHEYLHISCGEVKNSKRATFLNNGSRHGLDMASAGCVSCSLLNTAISSVLIEAQSIQMSQD